MGVVKEGDAGAVTLSMHGDTLKEVRDLNLAPPPPESGGLGVEEYAFDQGSEHSASSTQGWPGGGGGGGGGGE